MRHPNQPVGLAFPKPGKALTAMMVVLGCTWVALAVGFNYGGVGEAIIDPLVGNPTRILDGQIWRLITPILIHTPSGPGAISHIVTTLLGLYFLGTSLEDRWGPKRMFAFLLGAAAFAFACQVLLGLVITRLATPVFYGGLGMVEATAIAWALQNKNTTVRLFFVLPVTGMMLIGFVFLMSTLYVIAGAALPEGLITPFGGMLAGYLFSDASPLRKLYLKRKLRRIQAETAELRRSQATRRPGGPALRLIHGDKEPPKDKRFLN
jgi:membrane associated rhomboid family serine protease